MMTREDIMRELELLPVWQLRVPALPCVEPNVVTPKVVDVVVDESFIEMRQTAKLQELTQSQAFMHIASEDGHCIFVLPNVALQEDEAKLMHNICKAIRMSVKPAELSVITADIIQVAQPKLIIVMGETIAQTLLQSTGKLADLRGKIHKIQDIALVVTYDLAHLLQNLLDKAKVWDDLRLAMQAQHYPAKADNISELANAPVTL
jgi:DNA polymerase